MYFFFQVASSGIATGAIYGLIAVGYSLTFMTTKALNFALGMWVMLGGMLTYSLLVLHGIHPLLVLPAVVVALFLLGLVAERFTVLPFLRAGSDVWIMSTLAVGLLLIDFAEIIWGRSPTPVPPFLGKEPIYLGAVSILPQQLLIIAAACVTFVGLDLFYRKTLTGKAFRAVAHSGEVSGLMGINTRRVQAVSYATAAALAGFAGFLVVPLTLAEPQLGTVLGLKAFAIAIIAGLAAPRGILICGLAYGALEALISGYFYTGIRDILGLLADDPRTLSQARRTVRADGSRSAHEDAAGNVARRARAGGAGRPAVASCRAPITASSASSSSSTASSPSVSNILAGYAGQFSLGHAALMAMGAYTTAILTKALAPLPVLRGHRPPYLARRECRHHRRGRRPARCSPFRRCACAAPISPW